jgi:hypothetical protein
MIRQLQLHEGEGGEGQPRQTTSSQTGVHEALGEGRGKAPLQVASSVGTAGRGAGVGAGLGLHLVPRTECTISETVS